MSYIVQPDVVQYVCYCGLLKPISKLYYCRHCLQMRCGYCVCHEVDSHFCGKCAENIPSSEARLKKNRCSNCYDCPSCQHQLTIRIANLGQKSTGDAKSTPKKVYYLTCLFCRWSTRDVGIPDQSVASGGWPKRDNIYANRILSIQEKYKAILLWEKQQKLDIEKRKHIQRGKYPTLTDKTGLSAAAIRKRIGLPDTNKVVKPPDTKIVPAEAQDEIEVLDEEIFTKTLNLNEITTLEQRFLQPDWQSTTVDLLFPIQKHLSVKRSLRCRTCEHNVSKPEYNPNSIKFKIQLFAYYHIPEIRIMTCEPLVTNKVCELIIKICNPTQHQTTISFASFESENQENTDKSELSKSVESNEEGSSANRLLASPLARQPSLIVKTRPVDANLTGDIVLPNESVVIPPRDDAAEYDDASDVQHFQDDPNLVIWRRSNKVALKLKVTPNSHLKVEDLVRVGFTMEHIYINTITTTENKEPQKYKHKVRVILTVGKVLVADESTSNK